MKCNKELIIIGASGHGRVVAEIATRMNLWKKISFLDDNEEIKESMGISIIDKASNFTKYIDSSEIFVAIGNNSIRRNILMQLIQHEVSIPTLIHPNAIIGEKVEIGRGTVIMAGAIINCNSKIGIGCIINTGSTVDHDNIIGNYVHISPGSHLAGTVSIGDNTWLGIGSIVSNNLTVEDNCIIGAGAVVIKKITKAGTYIGVPARRLDINDQDTNTCK